MKGSVTNAAPPFVQRRRSAQNVGVGQPISRYRSTLEGDPNQSKMRAAIIAIMMVGLVVFLTSGSGWAQKDPPADAKQLAPPSPGGFVPDKLLPPPWRGRKEAKPLPKLSSKKRCLSKLDAGNYCYEVCDLEGGKKCRWVTPAEYMAHLEKRKPPPQTTPSNPSPGPPPWSNQEIAERLARNASGVCHPKACQRICENEPTPTWIVAHHLERFWLENDEIGGPMTDGRSYGTVLAEGGGYGIVPANRCNHIKPAAQ